MLRRCRAVGLASLVVVVAAAAVPGRSGAVEVPSLYSAEVPLDPDRDDPRRSAYRAALAQVILRVSGPALAADAAAFEQLFPEPSVYVVQFRPGGEGTLWVSFDGEAIERTLREAGETVWGSDRPLTLVWLAVDWGSGEREIIGSDDPERTADEGRSIDRNRLLRQRVLDMAGRRGLPVLFPLLDTDDLRTISFSDIWGGFDDQLLSASQRYDVSSILVGRVSAATAMPGRWSYYFAGEQQTFSGEPEVVINLVADTLAAELAISGSAMPVSVELRVAGIEGLAEYGRVSRLLESLPVVEHFAVTVVDGDEIRYRVEAHGGAERLRRTLRLNGLVEQELSTPVFPESGAGDVLEFFYDPDPSTR
jgi:hypothetical protein